MNIIKTIYILFKGDVADLKKKRLEAEKESEKVTKKLNTTKKASDEIGKSLGQVANQFAKIALSALTVGAILSDFKRVLGESIDLATFSRNTQTNILQLDVWGQALKRVGGDAKQFQSDLLSLAQHTGGSPQLALSLLPTFAKAFQNLNYMQARMVGQSFGLSDATIALLRQPKLLADTIAQQAKLDASLVAMQPNIDKFNFAWLNTQGTLRGLFLDIEARLLPGMTKTSDVLTQFINLLGDNKDTLVTGIKDIATGLTILAVAFAVLNAEWLIPLVAIGLLGEAFNKLNIDSQDLNETWKALKFTFNDLFSGKIGAYLGGQLFKNSASMRGQELYDAATAPTSAVIPYVDLMSASPYSMSPRLGTATGNKNLSVHINDINIQTDATNAEGISQDIGSALKYNSDILHLLNTYNTGIVA
jgi:hypothetical protein